MSVKDFFSHSFMKIWKVFVEGEGEVGDEGQIFIKLCEKKSLTDIACMLVEGGSMDPKSTYANIEGDGIPVLIGASLHGRLNVIESLIQAGADVDKATNNGFTALIAASGKVHAAIVEALIQAGADVDKATNNGDTALIVASEKGHGATVEVLIKAGADIDKAADDGVTALMLSLIHI